MKLRYSAGGALVLLLAIAACMAPSPEAPMPAETDRATPTAPAPGTADPTETTSSPAPSQPADALLAVELIDVRSGESFTLGALAAEDGPVLLEAMAVWCTTCLSQQREVVQAHEAGHFTSVSLDVDLSESPEQLAEFADREGFDWRFAMADADLYRALQERFGVGVTNPPSTPLIVIETDGTVRPLEFGRGVRSAEQLLAEIGGG
jgi:thiol-disulfide isomerase/thioredoxin